MESVELIASGYEWICPECDEFNKEIEVTEKVVCKECKTKYIVEDYNHSTG